MHTYQFPPIVVIQYNISIIDFMSTRLNKKGGSMVLRRINLVQWFIALDLF